jgi:hypothetical protein
VAVICDHGGDVERRIRVAAAILESSPTGFSKFGVIAGLGKAWPGNPSSREKNGPRFIGSEIGRLRLALRRIARVFLPMAAGRAPRRVKRLVRFPRAGGRSNALGTAQNLCDPMFRSSAGRFGHACQQSTASLSPE